MKSPNVFNYWVEGAVHCVSKETADMFKSTADLITYGKDKLMVFEGRAYLVSPDSKAPTGSRSRGQESEHTT